MIVMILATPKVGAKHELLFNKPASEPSHPELGHFELNL
jgi:hypothetical protein